MARVLVTAVVEAPVDRVWERIGRFDAPAEWLPFVASSPIDDGGDPRRVGCVRVVTQTDGLVFRERLVSLDDGERSHSYTFVGSPIPVTDHLTTLRALPVTDGDRTYVAWSSRFGIDPAEEQRLVGLIEQNFAAGLRSLGESLGGY